MKIAIEGTAKEIAALVLELRERERQDIDASSLADDIIRLQESLAQASQASLQ